MTTVLAVYDSEGCVGRCDARCHEARTPDCDCICGGRYHGVGAASAVQAATDYIDPDGQLRRAFAEAHGLDASELRVEAGQGALFA
jgi:orotate phosphoribosyltransferase